MHKGTARTAASSFVLIAVAASIAGCSGLGTTTGGTVAATPGGTSKGGVPLPQPYDYPPADGILRNGSFERGLEGWETWDQRGSRDPGNNGIEVADWAERKGKVLHVTRTSKSDGGGAGVIQRPDYDCSAATRLWITYKAYVNFEEGGNIAGRSAEWTPESGAQCRITYLDAQDRKHEWYDGVYITPTQGADTKRFLQVGDNDWVHRVSPDLMQLDPKPARIVEVRFGGFAWGFDAMLDDCQIVTGK